VEAAGDARLWPVATVMATGVFATTFVQTQMMGYLPLNCLLSKRMGLDSGRAATFMSLAMLPWMFKTIAGLLVDGMPLFGSRRRAYLMMSALTASVMWLLMGLAGAHYSALLILAIGMNVAIVFGSTTAGGLLVEAGQKFGASGRLSSWRVFAQNLGAGLAMPVGGLLADYALKRHENPLGWTSVAAIVPLLCMFLAAWLLLRERVAPARNGLDFAKSIWGQITNVLRWEMLLPGLLLFFIQAVPTFRSTSFYQYQTQTLKYSNAAMGWLGLAGYGVALLSSGVYAWVCRKVTLRASLYGGILVLALSALPYLFYQTYVPYMLRAITIEGVGTFLQFLAYLPLFDMMVRATPKGSEALGYSLLISVWNTGLVIGTWTGPMLYEHVLHKHMNSLIWLNAGVTLAGVVLIFLLPGALVEKREGK
jgi:predicted MFS family arabinose efflux permease